MTAFAPSARVSGGRIRGRAERGHVVFRGIPYAAPPQGAGRFAAPSPAPSWDGVRDATEPGPTAPAPARDFGRLDLTPVLGRPVRGAGYLTVTVTTPDPAAGGLPVLVFVHGGGFTAGTGQADLYDGAGFARDGVVVVTLNYRLGIAGWLDLPDAPANRGLLDVIAALEWVQDNIRAFGGAPDRVTVAGQSAGAMITAALLAAPRAVGLFQRAISQSGSGECAFLPGQAALATRAVGAALGLPPGGVTAAALADLPDDRLVAVLGGIPPIDHAAHGFRDPSLGASPCKPVIDGVVLTGQPSEVLVPAATDLLIGTNTDEADLYLVPAGRIATATERDLLAAARRRYPDSEARVATYRAAHPDATPGGLLARVVTDAFVQGSRGLADAHARRSTGRTYRYEFGWRPGSFGGALGACHCAELPFVFGTADLPSLHGDTALAGPGPTPADLVTEVHRAWVRFIAEGDPGWAGEGTHVFAPDGASAAFVQQ
ncbi:carboxylesterase/lipase family protein [Amycolatopsis pigmentata]|uniref:Carboxylic ester hydrolase n=1 Tax=Amycolatopsis pigmentata TaxID=450801 RepID=A0ABW5G4R5_9PSEU